MDLRILGPLEALDDGRLVRVAAAGSGRWRLFLLHANETLTTDRPIDELWGERPPATAAKTVQVCVPGCGRRWRPGRETVRPAWSCHASIGYELELDVDCLDAHRFERLVAEGRSELGAGRPERAVAALDEALALWRGPALPDLAYEPFAQREVARPEDLRVARRSSSCSRRGWRSATTSSWWGSWRR